MATTAKIASHGKEKTKRPSSAPSTRQNDPINVRRGLKSFAPTSASTNSLTIETNKPSPHYLKPTLSSNKDNICYYPKKTKDDTSLKYSHDRRKSAEKPPSPLTLKRTLSASPKGRTLVTSPPPPKASPRPVVDKTPKTPPPRNAKVQAVKKPTTIRKSVSPTKTRRPKKETKPTLKKKSISAPSTPLTKETNELVKVEENKVASIQKKVVAPVEEDEDDLIEVTVDEAGQPDDIDSELKINLDSCDSSILSEEHDLINNNLMDPSEERIKEVANVETNTKEAEQSQHNEESVEFQQDEPNVGEEGDDPKEDDTTDKEVITEKVSSSEEAGEEDKPRKLKFQQVKHLDEKEDEGEGSQRLKFKERCEELEVEEQEESESVVLKRQEVQGKKVSPMYNDVIEETASKLAQKRKNKVKALVGAFETVINLENETQGAEEE